VPALLPPGYCSDVHERLVLYKRLANCGSLDELTAMQEELVDRFGPLPEPAQALVESHRLRLLGHPFGVARLDATPEHVQIQFGAHASVDPARVIQLVQKERGWRLLGPAKLRAAVPSATLKERAAAARHVLGMLGGKAA
jgi:transcription-repair coupling factor (superfamily II helicase)